MDPQIYRCLSTVLHDGQFQKCSILDAGCGQGTYSGIIRPFCTYLVGCDLSRSGLVRAKDRGYYDDVVFCDVTHLPFRNDSFFAMIGSQLLEHMTKENGLVALKEFDRTSLRVFLTLPAEKCWGTQVEKAAERENVYEEHRSKWSVKDLKSCGFAVKGYGAILPVLGVPMLTELSFQIPAFAAGLIAFKKRKKLHGA